MSRGLGDVYKRQVWYDHPRSVVVRISKLVIDHDPVCVVVDPRSQAATLLGPLAEAGVAVSQPGPADVTVAHGEFLDLVNDHQLIHLEQAPLVAATLACWGFRRWEELAAPGAWVV